MVTGYITSFASGIFKKPQTKDGFGKFIQSYTKVLKERPEYRMPKSVRKFMEKRSMTAKEKKECTKWVLYKTRNWTKAQKKDLKKACSKIKIKAEPKPKPKPKPKVSPSYKSEAKAQVITKSRDVKEVPQAGIPTTFKIPPNLKIPLYILIGAGAILLIFKLAKGGAK